MCGFSLDQAVKVKVGEVSQVFNTDGFERWCLENWRQRSSRFTPGRSAKCAEAELN